MTDGVPPIRVVIADDHAAFRGGLRALLATAGDLEVVGEAATGDDAVAEASRRQPDVVLMDVNMPGIDGNEATRRLRASGGLNAAVPVIGFSAGTEAEQVQACYAAGMTDWLAKPLEPRKLYDALHRATSAAAKAAA